MTDLPSPSVEGGEAHPEATCQRCGRPNVWSWHAPSPLWNAVLRDPATGEDEWSIICPVCFAELAGESGVLEGASVWHFAPHDLDVAGLWDDGDGRVWDAEHCMWIEAKARAGAASPVAESNTWEQLRTERRWPTPNHMRSFADGLDVMGMIPRYGEILRWFADLCDGVAAAPPAAGLPSVEELAAALRGLEREPTPAEVVAFRLDADDPENVRFNWDEWRAHHRHAMATDILARLSAGTDRVDGEDG